MSLCPFSNRTTTSDSTASECSILGSISGSSLNIKTNKPLFFHSLVSGWNGPLGNTILLKFQHQISAFIQHHFNQHQHSWIQVFSEVVCLAIFNDSRAETAKIHVRNHADRQGVHVVWHNTTVALHVGDLMISHPTMVKLVLCSFWLSNGRLVLKCPCRVGGQSGASAGCRTRSHSVRFAVSTQSERQRHTSARRQTRKDISCIFPSSCSFSPHAGKKRICFLCFCLLVIMKS